MSSISAGVTTGTGLVHTSDTTGDLVLKTGASATTAMTISGTDQSVKFVGAMNLRSYLAGLTLSTAGSSATMSIAAGVCTDSTNVSGMTLAATSKTTSAWALGAAAGGLDTGTIANSTWYHFFVIQRPDTGVVDALISLSPTAPTMPTNYTLFRRIGSGKTNGSAQWTSFTQTGDYFVLKTSVVDVQTNNPGTASVTATLASVPTGVKVEAKILSVIVSSTAGNYFYWLRDLSSDDEAPVATNLIYASQTAGASFGGNMVSVVMTNTSAQIGYRCNASDANTTFQIRTMAYYDRRGQDA